MRVLQVLPEGFALPPLPYLLVLVVGIGAVVVGVRRRSLAFEDAHVLALVPWILTGSCVHALFVVGALPPLLEPLGGTPAVYATLFVVVGLCWLAFDSSLAPETTPRALAAVGVAALAVCAGGGVAVGLSRGTFSPFWSTVALVVSLAVGAVTWVALTRAVPRVEATGRAGLVAVFGHVLDGISTAVGVDVLGFGERTPLSRVIIETAATLPTADLVGSGWLFVLVKLAVVGFVVVLFSDMMAEEPVEGRLLLGVVAAVGMGPGAHNLLLFAIAG